MSVVNNTFLHRDDDISEAAKIEENACVVIEGKSQLVENSIIRYALQINPLWSYSNKLAMKWFEKFQVP